jgi:signal transduction histidine kinase/CheY-like chemotaxis protein
MPLRRAILFIFICTLALPTLIGCVVALSFALKTHSSLERAVMTERVDRLEGSYQQQLAELDALTADWAQWDDAVAFASNPTDAGMRSRLTAGDSYTAHALSLVAYVTFNHEMIFGAAFSPDHNSVAEFTNSPDPNLIKILKSVTPGHEFGENKHGALVWNGSAYSFSAKPLIDIKHGQSGKGFLVIARKIDNAFWSRLTGRSTLNVKSVTLDSGVSPPTRGVEIAENEVQGVTSLDDGNGLPIVKVSVSADRGLFRQVAEVRDLFLLSLAILGVFSLTATYFLIHHKVTRRVEALQRDTGAIEASGDFSLRVGAKQNDEIGRLGADINAMLARLDTIHSEVIAARKDADRANRAKTSFISKVSHELRTPIFSIQGYLRIQRKCKIDAKARECAEKINASADALLSVVNSIIDFAELSSTQIQLRASEFGLAEVVQEIVMGQAAAIREKSDVTVVVKVSTALPRYFTMDERRFCQVVNHLFSNGIKFTEKGNVELTVSDVSGGIKVVVRDTGVGMSPEEIKATSEAFEQLEDTSNRRFNGVGLGLTLCRKVLDAFKGSLTLESNVGRGTVAEAFIPLEYTSISNDAEQMVVVYTNKAVTIEAADRMPTPVPVRALRVLIAEDELPNQIVIKAMVEDLGYTTVCVENGLQMIDALTGGLQAEAPVSEKFDIVLADLDMPECNGVEAIRRLRQAEIQAGISSSARTPVLIVTADGFSAAANEAKEAGGNGCIVKPVQPEQLAHALHEAIASMRRE